MTNAYILITDLHLADRNIRARIDYRNELNVVLHEIESTISSLKGRGVDSVNLLFLGDVFDRGYRNVLQGINDAMWFTRLSKKCNVYTVVGNHELTYFHGNPFYTLATGWETNRANTNLKYKTVFTGKENILHTPDVLQDGNVAFYFNHYGLPALTPEKDTTSIGLFHLDYHPKLVVQDAERNGRKLWHSDNQVQDGLVNGYKYCFFGHMHTMQGIYETEAGTTLCFLGSLGRTSVSDLATDPKRMLPIVLVRDGELESIEPHYFTLPSIAESADMVEVEKNHKDYEKLKQKVAIKTKDIFYKDTAAAVAELLSTDPYSVRILQSILNDEASQLISLLEELKNV